MPSRSGLPVTLAAWLLTGATALSGVAQEPPTSETPAEPAPRPPQAGRYEVTSISVPVVVDGSIDEAAWRDATVIPLRYEWFPGDNTVPPVRTQALVTYDRERLYVAFRAFDPEPQAIRAHLMDRDAIETFVQDDHVTVMVDPFNDERRAFQFRVNPLGIQAEAIFSQVEFIEDFSWDIIWDSAGRITEDGYVVELAIPFNQLRFPATDGPQTWGFELGRSWPREVRHRMTASPRDRNNTCLLCQLDKVRGFEDIEPGLNLEIDPTLTGTRTDVREDFPTGDLEAGEEDAEPGVTARWGFTPSLTLNATVNPDFSQVEADVAQLEVNERFALFFPEKRPFFLEGIDLFATPIRTVFTRTIVDPDWGLKLSGKQGANAGGLFAARDEVTSLIIPANEASRLAFLEQETDASVLRYRRDLGRNSTLGVLYTGREGDDYHNRVGGVDGFVRMSERDELRFQYLRSDTQYPDSLALEFGQPSEAFDDDAWTINYDHDSREWAWGLGYEDLGPGFRADSGFVPRVDARTWEGDLARIWWGEEEDWYSRWALGATYERTENDAGRLTDEDMELFAELLGPLQSVVFVEASSRSILFQGRLHDDLGRVFTFLEFQPGGWGKPSLEAGFGETVDFANNQPADFVLLEPAVEVKVGRHVNAQASHIFQRLDVAGGTLSEANISQLRLIYNFNPRTFVRLITQYRRLDQDPTLFTEPVEPEIDGLFNQLLFSYKLNPQTVLFVGYSDDHLGLGPIDLTQTSRTFFIKLGYAWIL